MGPSRKQAAKEGRSIEERTEKNKGDKEDEQQNL